MKDHPQHTTEILGGMWGLNKRIDENQAKEIIKLILDKNDAIKYNKNSQKGLDQNFLTDKVYHLIKDKSITHDSYLCKKYKHSEPFPTRRIDGLFVGINDKYGKLEGPNYECPIECRPNNHLTWINC